MISYGTIMNFTERKIIFKSMILVTTIGCVTKRIEMKKKSHLQANTNPYGQAAYQKEIFKII
jgi:hypothetical protein